MTHRVRHSLLALVAASVLPLGAASAQHDAPSTHYHVARRITIGGDAAGWDYLALDTVRNRLFIARSDRVMVVDPANGHVLGTIGGLDRGHGVAFTPTGHGFITSGADSTVTMFDLATLAPLGKSVAAVDDDAVLYDAPSGNVFTFNGDAHSATVIDAATGTRVATIALGGAPEFGVSADDGKLYVNIESTSEVVEIDARARRVTRRWSLAPCQSPSGLAIDVVHHRLFSGCRNKVMAISDAHAGKVIATVPIGAGVDADRFDAATGNAFASNGDGTITVVHEDSPTAFHVTQTVKTMPGARTMELDPRTHTLYTVSARFSQALASAKGASRRPPILPGTFTLLVIEP